MWRLALVLIILLLNLVYIGSKITGDMRARRWVAVLVGVVCTIAIYGIIIGGIYFSVESSTDL